MQMAVCLAVRRLSEHHASRRSRHFGARGERDGRVSALNRQRLLGFDEHFGAELAAREQIQR